MAGTSGGVMKPFKDKNFVDRVNRRVAMEQGEAEDQMEFENEGGGEPILRDPNAAKIPTGKELVERGMQEIGESMDELEQNPPSSIRNPDDKNAPPEARPVYDQELLSKLFKTTHGTSFNPKAKGDVKAMAEIETLLDEMGGELGNMTPNQFALQIYRKFKYL